MARQTNPRLAPGARLGLVPAIPPGSDLVAELGALREAVASLERRLVGHPGADAKALARAADAQRAKLEEVAAALGELQRRQADAVRHLAELRAAQAKPAPPRPGEPWRDAMARLRRRLGRLAEASLPRRGPAPPPAPPAPSPTWVLAGAKQRGESRSVLAVVLGLGAGEVAALVPRLVGAQASAGAVPVFVTDCSEFEPYRVHRACFEYLPPPPARRGPELMPERDWELYRLRRFCILCGKWQPLRIVAFGVPAGRWLAIVQDSARVPADVKALIASAGEPRPSPPAGAPALPAP